MRPSGSKPISRKRKAVVSAPPVPRREAANGTVSYPIPVGLHSLLKEEAPRQNAALQPYKVVSLFSGAMGLDIGLEKTGRFVVIACVEKEKAFADSIEANKKAGRILGRPVVFHRDITQLEPAELMNAVGLKPGDLDLLVGGPPCQSFSTAGKRGTVQDHRGTLLWQFLRFVEALRPKFFLMENVRGLLSAVSPHLNGELHALYLPC